MRVDPYCIHWENIDEGEGKSEKVDVPVQSTSCLKEREKFQ